MRRASQDSFMTDNEFNEFAEQVEKQAEAEKPVPLAGEKIVQIASGLLNKIDTEGRGYFDINMLRAYC